MMLAQLAVEHTSGTVPRSIAQMFSNSVETGVSRSDVD